MDADEFKTTQKIGSTDKTFWGTGSPGEVRVSELSGKTAIDPQGTASGSGYDFKDTENITAQQLSDNDPMLGTMVLDPKVALGSRIEFDVGASSVYTYWDTDKSPSAGQVNIETDLTTILIDPYVFSFVL